MRQRLESSFVLIAFILLVQVFYILPLNAQTQPLPETERIAVLSFWAYDQQGNIVPQANETDLARLTSVLPRAIAARLVQANAFEVVDESLLEAYNATPAIGETELDRVEELLTAGHADQVITGSVAQIQQSVVTSVQRYVMGPNGPRVAGASVVRANSAAEAVNSVESLLSQAFPPDADVVPRPISRVVVVPNVLRIPVGGSAPIQAYAIDDLGRTLSAVTLVFDSSDETRVMVDDHGNITGVSPGNAQVTLSPLGRPLATNTALPKVEVTVVGPNLGLRAGANVAAGSQTSPRVGLRLTPAHEIRTSTATQTLPQAGSNPVNVLTSFFGSLIGNQMLTVDMDVTPGADISMTLSAVQRTSRSYFGTGVGVAVPMAEDGPSGVILRLTMGTQLPFTLMDNMTHPVEMNVDFILGGGQSEPQARLGLSVGVDLFQ